MRDSRKPGAAAEDAVLDTCRNAAQDENEILSIDIRVFMHLQVALVSFWHHLHMLAALLPAWLSRYLPQGFELCVMPQG